jgi:hypothetical protein
MSALAGRETFRRHNEVARIEKQDGERLGEMPGEAKGRPSPQGMLHFLVLSFELGTIMRDCRASSDTASDLGCSNTSQNGSSDRPDIVQHQIELVHGPIIS